MPAPAAGARPSITRLVLRGSLLAGTLFDITLLSIFAWLSLEFARPPLIPEFAVSLLMVRAGVQGFACYDLRRFAPLLPLVGVSLILPFLFEWLAGAPFSGYSPIAAPIGVAQLAARRGVAQ